MIAGHVQLAFIAPDPHCPTRRARAGLRTDPGLPAILAIAQITDMSDADRLLCDLTALLDSPMSQDDLRLFAHLRLSSFIGRVAVRDDDRYAPPEEVIPVLQEARRTIQQMPSGGLTGTVRVELLSELDKAIASIRPRPSLPPLS